MHDRARFPVLLAALLLSLPVRAGAEEPIPWQLHGPADVKCDQSSEGARQRFWESADWGVVPGYRERMVEYCEGAAGPASPSMRCTPDLRFCQARHVRIDVPAPSTGSTAGPTGASSTTAVSAACALKETFPPSGRFFGGIADWTPELPALTGSAEPRPCDVVIREPTLLIKPDSRANIYHGLCDHVNLFLSAWIAGWQDADDLQIVTWEPELRQERVPSGWYELYDSQAGEPVAPQLLIQP